MTLTFIEADHGLHNIIYIHVWQILFKAPQYYCDDMYTHD